MVDIKRKLNLEQEKEIINLYINEKLSLSKIGLVYNVSSETISNVLVRNDIKLRCKGGKEQIDKKDLFKMYYEDNMTMEEIAKKYDTTAKAISYQFNNIYKDNYIKKPQTLYYNQDLIQDFFKEIDTEF